MFCLVTLAQNHECFLRHDNQMHIYALCKPTTFYGYSNIHTWSGRVHLKFAQDDFWQQFKNLSKRP